MSERPVLVCGAAADLPMAVRGSTTKRCEMCGTAVWVAPSSKHLPNPRIICTLCAPALMALDGEVLVAPITDAQRAELHTLGVTDAQIDAMMEFWGQVGR